MADTPQPRSPFLDRTPVEWALVGFAILGTAARESGLLPEEPWGQFIGIVIAGLFGWGILVRPTPRPPAQST